MGAGVKPAAVVFVRTKMGPSVKPAAVVIAIATVSLPARALLRLLGHRRWDADLESLLLRSGLPSAPHLLNELLRSISDPKLALRLFLWASKLPDHVPSPESLRIIAGIWSHFKHFHAFLRISDLYAKPPPPPRLAPGLPRMTRRKFTVLLMGYGHAGMLDDMLDVLQRMSLHGFTPDLVHYNCVLDALAKADRIEESQALYRKMLELGIGPNVVTYTIMICGLGKAGKPDLAYQYFLKANVEDDGGSDGPDCRAFAALISALCKAGRSNRAFEVFVRMSEMRLDLDLPLSNLLIQTLCQQGLFSEASKALSSMACSELSSSTLATAIAAFYKGKGHAPRALMLIQAMEKSGMMVHTYSAILYSLCKSGEAHKVEDFIARMKESGFICSLSTYNTLVTSLCRQNMVQAAVILIKAMKNADVLSPDVVTYTTLIKGFCMVQKIGDAMEVLENMADSGCQPDTVCYNTALLGLCSIGAISSADALLEKMRNCGCPPTMVTYNIYVKGLCNAGRPREAISILERAKCLGYSPNSRTFLALLAGLCDKLDFEMAWKVFKDVARQRGPLDAICYALMISRFSKANRVNESEELFCAMNEKGFAPSLFVYHDLISCYCRNRCLDKASDLYFHMLKSGRMPHILTRKVLDAAFLAARPLGPLGK